MGEYTKEELYMISDCIIAAIRQASDAKNNLQAIGCNTDTVNSFIDSLSSLNTKICNTISEAV